MTHIITYVPARHWIWSVLHPAAYGILTGVIFNGY